MVKENHNLYVPPQPLSFSALTEKIAQFERRVQTQEAELQAKKKEFEDKITLQQEVIAKLEKRNRILENQVQHVAEEFRQLREGKELNKQLEQMSRKTLEQGQKLQSV